MTRKHKKTLARIAVAAALLAFSYLLPLGKEIGFLLFLSAYLVVGYDILLKALRGIASLQPFDENFLMAVATVGAVFLGEYTEACAVMLFYQVGELFQSVAVGKSRRNIAELMELRPDSANLVLEGGAVEVVSPEDIEVGSLICVKVGEKIALDGIVEKGGTSLDTSALTGESAPRYVREGDEVKSGFVNLTDMIYVRVTSAYGESTAAKILELVENAGFRKSRSEKFITKFARYYTPAVCLSALALALLPPAIALLSGSAAEWSTWIYRTLTFLVISCPCALVISIPLTFFAAIGGMGREGILVKGSDYLEKLAKTKCVVFDKTGTLTDGNFEVSDIKTVNASADEVLYYAAAAEYGSNHPIAKSIRLACGKHLEGVQNNVKEYAGRGITAEVDGRSVAVGNASFMREKGIECEASPSQEVFVSCDGVLIGSILLSDKVKDGALEVCAELKKAGVARVAMLTGDRESEALKTANRLRLDEVRFELLPQDKVGALEKIMEDTIGVTAFVGDGINDAPVIRRADVGFAMGALGSDAAIEAADIVLMDDDPQKCALAIRRARKTMRIVYQNIAVAIGIKLGFLVLGAFGVTGIWAAVFADVGVMVLAVLNALRALKKG